MSVTAMGYVRPSLYAFKNTHHCDALCPSLPNVENTSKLYHYMCVYVWV